MSRVIARLRFIEPQIPHSLTSLPRARIGFTRSSIAYAGAAFIALPGEERDELASRLEALTKESPAIPRLRVKGAHWVRPDIIARVRHLAGAKSLRHGTVRSLVGC